MLLIAAPFGLLVHFFTFGTWAFVGFMVLLWTNDTGAYLVGRAIGTNQAAAFRFPEEDGGRLGGRHCADPGRGLGLLTHLAPILYRQRMDDLSAASSPLLPPWATCSNPRSSGTVA